MSNICSQITFYDGGLNAFKTNKIILAYLFILVIRVVMQCIRLQYLSVVIMISKLVQSDYTNINACMPSLIRKCAYPPVPQSMVFMFYLHINFIKQRIHELIQC